MSDTHETIADIVAWLRRPIEGENAYLTLWRDEIAARIEVALRRERGDCAKLREACANIAEYARSAICHATDAHLLGYLNQIEGWSKAALAAPPRNCDLPEVAKAQPNLAEQAWRVFRRSHKDSNLDAYGLLRCIRWLLAPATEKEGGAK